MTKLKCQKYLSSGQACLPGKGVGQAETPTKKNKGFLAAIINF
jgi:hypothetical protein